MPELRRDPISGQWVIIAPERAQRPIQTTGPRLPDSLFDPFAEGNEFATPQEIAAVRPGHGTANSPGWRVRVIPNRFPALTVEGTLEKHGEGLYDAMTGIGAHEVIVECPHGETNLSRLPREQIADVLHVYRDRLADLKRDRRLLHAVVFKNQGAMAGASLPHSHSQLVATSMVPPAVLGKLAAAEAFYRQRGRCIYEDMIRQELKEGTRVVLETPLFLAFCPYASRFPFEMMILPRFQASHYETAQRHQLDELAAVLKTVLLRLEAALENPDYNFVLQTAPFEGPPELPHTRWHIEILPRITGVAGFEWGTGLFINPVPPEQAAEFLREIDRPVTTHALT